MNIVADIGGTNTRIARVEGDTFLEPIIYRTPEVYAEGLSEFISHVHTLTEKELPKQIMIGVAGVLAADKKAIVGSRHLQDWALKPFSDDLHKALGAEVYLENDAALVGLGEAVFGAGKGAGVAAYITVSTGVNGVRIVDGKIDRSFQGFEIGGQYLSMNPMQTLEELVSGSAVHDREGKHPREIPKDSALWEELAKTLAFGVHNTILHWSPEKVVLGGSMFNTIGISVQRVDEHVRKLMRKFATTPAIVHSSLGDLGGLHGGVAFLTESQ